MALALVQLLVGSAALGYRWLAASTQLSPQEARRLFAAEQTRGTLSPSASFEPLEGSATDADHDAAADESPIAVEDDVAVLRPVVLRPPEAGMYTWDTEGTEESAGVGRTLPPVSYRSVTHTGDRAWTNDHVYSAEHRDRFDVEVTDQGISTTRQRAEVSFGPFARGHDVVFDPPMRFVTFPVQVGQRWQGAWSGAASGTYEGRTFERTTLKVGHDDVDVWGVEVRIEYSGDLTGYSLLRAWVSTELRMTVRESYERRVRSGSGEYTGSWTIRLRSLRPQ